jgi:hypothetical protein
MIAKKKLGPLVHGVYAKDVLLPWDDRHEFAQLHAALKLEFFPVGASEDEAVFDLAHLHWQKRTLWRLRTAAIARDSLTQAILATEGDAWVDKRRELRKLAREERKILKETEKTFIEALANVSETSKKLRNEPQAERQELLIKRFQEAFDLLKKTVLPEFQKIRSLPDVEDAVDKNFDPQELEKFLHLEVIVEARIGKVMARLVAIKEFKRTPAGNPPKQLTPPRPAPRRVEDAD